MTSTMYIQSNKWKIGALAHCLLHCLLFGHQTPATRLLTVNDSRRLILKVIYHGCKFNICRQDR